MQTFLITIFAILSVASFWQFIRSRYKLAPLWLMLSAWFVAIAISQLKLSSLELPWPGRFWFLVLVSLASFTIGFLVFERIWTKYPWWEQCQLLVRNGVSLGRLRILIYGLACVSAVGLYLYYTRSGNFPLLAADPDAFRFEADTAVPGLINYASQLARVFIPLSFFLMFWPARHASPLAGVAGGEKYNFKKHWDLSLLSVVGVISLLLFASRTQIFFIDLWIMAMYLLVRKPNLKQALKFYPIFLLVTVLMLAAIPLYRQYQSYGDGYLAGITGIDTTNFNPVAKAFMPIYVGVSFNQQALLHADSYYRTHELQHGKVSLDPFTNIFGKLIPGLNNLKSNFDLGAIFYSWWNTGTYLFPFVQDFGTAAFFTIPFIMAGLLTLSWRYWESNPNFLSLNLYAYSMFFIVMTVYLSFTVRAEMYLDLMLLFVSYLFVSKKINES